MRSQSAFLGMAAAAAVSGASFSAFAGPCPSVGFLSSYLSGGSNATCTVLDKTISNVTFSSDPHLFSDIPVEPVTVTNNPGLGFSVGSGAVRTATITFTITAPSSDPMTDASLMISSTGLSQVSETLSNGSSLSTSTSSTTDSITFAATTSLNVTDTFTTTGDFIGGFSDQFSETPNAAVPEPSSLALLGIGLPALGLVRRRNRR